MILIAESGSTKTDWILIQDNNTINSYKTDGINPFFQDSDAITKTISKLAHIEDVTQIFFYGAGCANSEQNSKVRESISKVFNSAEIEVNSDLLAAARATSPGEESIVSILGTGSNSALFSGEEIIENVSPLGYILGDEGSGAVMGKILVGDILKYQAPTHIIDSFFKEYNIPAQELIHSIYREPFPNRFSAQFTRFMANHITDSYISDIIKNSFESFFKRNIAQYNREDLEVNFVGSIAHYFKDHLSKVAKEQGYKIGKIISSPIDNLILFHNKQNSNQNNIRTMKRVTEQPSNYDNLEKMSPKELLENINREDAKVHQAVSEAIPAIEEFVSQLITRVSNGGRLFYMGAGTSGRLGVLDASELPPTFGVSKDIVIGLIAGGERALKNAVESAEDAYNKGWEELLEYNVTSKDSILGIAASGTTPYVIGAITKAREEGLLTAAISCNPDSPLSNAAEIAIEAVVGPEFLTGSTRMKSGTAQKLILNMITTTLMIKLGKVEGNRMVNMQLTNKKLIERGALMIQKELGLDLETSQEILLKEGSVKKAITAYLNSKEKAEQK